MARRRKPLRAVILDVDGTLVDSNEAHTRAWAEALAEHGHDVPLDRIRWLIGMGGDKLLPRVAGVSRDDPEGEAIDIRRGEIFRDRYLPGIRSFNGTRALLEQIRDRGLRLLVASSAKADELDPLLEIAGATDLIDEKASADSADVSKPDPDIVEAAMADGGVEADETVMIGDTPYDLEAARRAGVDLIGFRSGGWDDEGLDGAVAIYDGPADLLRQLDASPIGRRSKAGSAGERL